MGAITMYGYPLIGLLIFWLFEPNTNVYNLVFRGVSIPEQLVHGLVFGTAAFLVVYVFLRSKLLSDISTPIFAIAKKMNWVQIVFISVAAGVGEELLFRVCLQHFWGLWPTAIIFVAIHGYLDFTNSRVFAYGIFMSLVSGGFGLLYIKYGSLAPIAAHFMIDFLILGYIKRTPLELLVAQSETE